MPDLATNVLYYGDNLDILRRRLPGAAVDLVYLDRPFNSNRDYDVIFRDESGNRSSEFCVVRWADCLGSGPYRTSACARSTAPSAAMSSERVLVPKAVWSVAAYSRTVFREMPIEAAIWRSARPVDSASATAC